MNKIFLKILSLLALTCSALAHEGNWTAARPDGHAPISVMGDHMHKMGESMISYRYMTMDMKGLLKGSSDITKAQAAPSYPLSMMGNMLPKDMSMDMHMFGTMHAISDKWTLMGMINYLDNEMSMQSGMEMESTGLVTLNWADSMNFIHGPWSSHSPELGLSLPTGSIDEKNSGNILGYGMQLGSGTWDFTPAITFLGQTDDYSWGAQFGGVLRIGENDQDYSLGNRLGGFLWAPASLPIPSALQPNSTIRAKAKVDGEDSVR